MPADPKDVVAALRAALPAAVDVRLVEQQGRPYGVIEGTDIAETWVDLHISVGADETADAVAVAEAILAFEGWPRRSG